MSLFVRKKDSVAVDMRELSKKFQDCEMNSQFLELAVRALLALIKEFSFDVKELGTDQFRKGIDDLSEKIVSEKKKRKIETFFERHKRIVKSFAERQNKYINDRENELRDIINLLTKAIATSNAENLDFNEKIIEQSKKFEQITQLDDIKVIKNSLKNEIEEMMHRVQEKQSLDAKRIEILSGQVSTLKTELEEVKKDTLRDGLTGAYNEQALDRYLKSLVEKNIIGHFLFSMLILDIDNFDNIENTYGPKLVKRVVLAAANECKMFFRSNDFIARYKKGTFVIVLPGESRRSSYNKAKRLCKTIAAKRYSVNDDLDGHMLSYTVCIGVSTYRKGDTVNSVTGRAVKALHTAKGYGKNRVVSEKSRLFFSRGETEGIETL